MNNPHTTEEEPIEEWEAGFDPANSNLAANEAFKFIGLSSASSFSDPAGVPASVRDGWNSIVTDEGSWECKEGIVIRFDGEPLP